MASNRWIIGIMRPVDSGRAGFNTHLSEILSQILEPVALEMSGAEMGIGGYGVYRKNEKGERSMFKRQGQA